jgi:hypothetical protein
MHLGASFPRDVPEKMVTLYKLYYLPLFLLLLLFSFPFSFFFLVVLGWQARAKWKSRWRKIGFGGRPLVCGGSSRLGWMEPNCDCRGIKAGRKREKERKKEREVQTVGL